MHMVQALRPMRWTADMVRALPEDRNRCEVIEGELFVSPGPSWIHQHAVAALFVRLYGFLRGSRAGHPLVAPADVEFSDDTLVQPDIFVVPLVHGKAPRRWEEVRQLLLAIEVSSPSTARTDRVHKRELYLSRGAREYWVVDIDAQLIERWRAGDVRPEILDGMIEWRPDDKSEPFVIDVAEYFAEVLDD